MIFFTVIALLTIKCTITYLHQQQIIKVSPFVKKLFGTLHGIDQVIRFTLYVALYFSGLLSTFPSRIIQTQLDSSIIQKSFKLDHLIDISARLRRLIRYTKTVNLICDVKRLLNVVMQTKDSLKFKQLSILFISDTFNALYFIIDNFASLFIFGIKFGSETDLILDSISNWVWILSSLFAVTRNFVQIYIAITEYQKNKNIVDLCLIFFKNSIDTFMAACYIWPFIASKKVIGLCGMIIGSISISRLAK